MPSRSWSIIANAYKQQHQHREKYRTVLSHTPVIHWRYVGGGGGSCAVCVCLRSSKLICYTPPILAACKLIFTSECMYVFVGYELFCLTGLLKILRIHFIVKIYKRCQYLLHNFCQPVQLWWPGRLLRLIHALIFLFPVVKKVVKSVFGQQQQKTKISQ